MPRVPKYRHFKPRNLGFVEYQRHRTYFSSGPYNSAQSLAEYAAFLRKISIEPNSVIPAGTAVTVSDLVAAFLDWAIIYYAGNKEFVQLREACKPLLAVERFTLVDDFRPANFKRVREAMVSGQWHEPEPRPWSRPHINHQMSRLRRVFSWGVENDMVSGSVLAALKAVKPLQKGRTAAWEPDPVLPVADTDVEAVLPYVSPVVADMIQLHRISGMRSENVCGLRPCEVDCSGDIWVYQPTQHKRAWMGTILKVFLGPKAQAILKPYLDRDPQAYCFSPLESESWRLAKLRKDRKTKVQPSQAARTPREHPKRPRRDHYAPDSYRRAIWYGFEKADRKRQKEAKKNGTTFVPIVRWHPHQLRHTCGTAVRKRFGLAGAGVYLGHGCLEVTEVYAEQDWDLARKIAAEIG